VPPASLIQISEIPKPLGTQWIQAAAYSETLKLIIKQQNDRMIELRKNIASQEQ
jgi:hypothetical protein